MHGGEHQEFKGNFHSQDLQTMSTNFCSQTHDILVDSQLVVVDFVFFACSGRERKEKNTFRTGRVSHVRKCLKIHEKCL